jgi:hypothetical protein
MLDVRMYSGEGGDFYVEFDRNDMAIWETIINTNHYHRLDVQEDVDSLRLL